MHKTLIAALALTGAAAFPALAQDTTQNQGQTGGQSGSQSGQQMQAQQGGQMSEDQMRSRMASQAQVRDALTQSGFEEVTLLDAAYLVSARAPSGEMVMMVVNPSGLMQGMMQGMGQPGMGQPGMGQDATGSTGSTGTMPGQQDQGGQSETNQ